MGYLTTDQEDAFADLSRPAIFFRLDTDPALHLWAGFGDIEIGILSESAGTLYHGLGRFMALPQLEVMVNGMSDRIEFFVSGFGPEAANFIDLEAPPVKGAECIVGLSSLDERYQPKCAIVPIWTGVADFRTMRQPKSKSAAQDATRTLGLSVGAGTTGRSRPRLAVWEHKTHMLEHPGVSGSSGPDLIFSLLARYERLYQAAWPRF